MPFDTTLDPTTDVILGAITLLEEHGWHKGGDPFSPQLCIKDAIRLASGVRLHIGDLAIARIRKANGIEIDLPYWNDAQERTKEQVLDALRNTLVAPP